MKLFYSSASPYVRKVLACAVACGLDHRIERVTTNPWDSPPELLAQNPLSKVPCLITDDGLALFDSPVICEFLDSIGAASLFPSSGALRWHALKCQAIADGILDAAIARRQDGLKPVEAARTATMERNQAAITRALDVLAQDPPLDHLDIGTISVACALGYLDFRFADENWRDGRPLLEQWFAAMSQRPELTATAPS